MTKLFVELMESRRLFAAGTLIPVPDVVGATYDPVRNRLYVASGSAGEIYTYDAGTSQMLEPIRVGAGPIGQIDLSPDGTTLYTVLAQLSGQGSVGTGGLMRIDLASREVTRTPYSLASQWTVGKSVAVDATGKVVFGGGGFATVSLQVYDPANPANGVTEFAPVTQTEGEVTLVASGDRKVLFVPQTYAYQTPAVFLDVSGGRLLSRGMPGDMFGGGVAAINFDGSLVAIPTRGVFDRAFNRVAAASVVGVTSVFVPGTSYVVAVDQGSGVLRSYNLGTSLAGPSLTVEGLRSDPSRPWEAERANGRSFISSDGTTAFVALKGGYREVALPVFPYDPPKLTGPTTVKEGQVLSLSGTAEFGPGASAIEWDTDYDGVTFTPDLVGSTVDVTGLNGPGPTVIAARLGAGERSSVVVTRTINVEGTAPTARLEVVIDPVSRILMARVENVVDVAADLAAGMRYDFDLDGDGVYEIAGATSSVATRVVPVDATLPVTVRARVVDVDGLGTEYSTRVGLVLQAVIGATPATVDAGSTLTLDATGSFGATLPIATYEWDLNYDGNRFDPDVSGTTAELMAPARETAVGIWERTVALRVTDTSGAKSVVTRGVRVVKLAPVVLGVEASKAVGAAVSRTVEVRVRAGSGLDAGSVAGSRLRLVGVESGGVTVESAGVSVREDAVAGVYVLSYVFNAPGVGWMTAFDGQYSANFLGESLTTNEGIALDGTVGEVGFGHAAAVAGADLSVAIVGMPVSVRAGKVAKVTLVVRNEGSVASGSGAGVRVLFSSDRLEGGGDEVLARVKVPAKIKVGASKTFSATIKVPESRGGSDGFMVATLDRGQAEPVENSGNNWAAPAEMRVEKRWFVQLTSALKVSGPLFLKPNARSLVSYSLRNVGTLNATGEFSLTLQAFRVSTSGGPDEMSAEETQSGTRRVGPGGSINRKLVYVVNDGSEPPGQFYLRMTITFSPLNGTDGVTLVTESARFTIPG